MAKLKHLMKHLARELETPLIMGAGMTAGTKPDKVAFLTNTLTYTCNPKYISEKLAEMDHGLDIVWLTEKEGSSLSAYPANVRTVPLHSFKGYQEAASAKVWVDNGVAFSSMFKRRPDQIHIQTMHGSLGIKRLDGAVNSRKKHFWGRREILRESTLTDYVITNSAFEEDVFRTVFWKDVPMLRLGHARTDILFKENSRESAEIRRKLAERYGIPEDHNLVLYAPTHRGGFRVDIDFEKVLAALEERFGGTFSFLIRFHIRSEDLKQQSSAVSRIYNVTDYPDIQELMLAADAGITDYSSWIFDYVVTKKPGFIYAPDLEKYNNVTGLYYPLEETPFPIAMNNRELAEKILSFDTDTYLRRTDEFLAGKEAVDDGHSAERAAQLILKLMGRSPAQSTNGL